MKERGIAYQRSSRGILGIGVQHALTDIMIRVPSYS